MKKKVELSFLSKHKNTVLLYSIFLLFDATKKVCNYKHNFLCANVYVDFHFVIFISWRDGEKGKDQ